jgi:hypothetical protein
MYNTDHHVSLYAAKDAMKHTQTKQVGITLITVPFWWDRTPQSCVLLFLSPSLILATKLLIERMFSLIATIKEARPDLLQDIVVAGPSIPSQMPTDLCKPTEFVEDIGEPINACFLTQNSHINPTGW